MSTLTITTNNHSRLVLDFDQLPEAIQKDFDYTSPKEAHDFIQYRGHYYDVSDMMIIDGGAPEAMKAWQGYCSDSAFSGVLVRYDDDSDRVIMATYVS